MIEDRHTMLHSNALDFVYACYSLGGRCLDLDTRMVQYYDMKLISMYSTFVFPPGGISFPQIYDAFPYLYQETDYRANGILRPCLKNKSVATVLRFCDKKLGSICILIVLVFIFVSHADHDLLFIFSLPIISCK